MRSLLPRYDAGINFYLCRDSLISKPRIIPRAEHPISRQNLPDSALKVLHRLNDAGFQAYLVGGCVRDMLLGMQPKDFDVATDATPEQVKSLFRNCRLIGRRFRLAHVIFGREMIEVATFRGQHSENIVHSDEGRILRDNVYGSLEEDAFRRDFTINALYYGVDDLNIIDYTDAIHDIHAKRLRLIGDPETRFREDPVRMLRAVRFAAKLGFKIDESNEQQIFALGDLLEDIPAARLFDEVIKLLQSGHGVQSLRGLQHYNLLQYLVPMTHGSMQMERAGYWQSFIEQALNNTDQRLQIGKTTNPAFMYAVLLWAPVREYLLETGASGLEQGAPKTRQIQDAAAEVFNRQVHYTAIPRRFTTQIGEIWAMQPRLEQYEGERVYKLLAHPRFRAAYDFLLLRESVGEATNARGQFWTDIQEHDERAQEVMEEARMSRSHDRDRGRGPSQNRRRRPRRSSQRNRS